MPQTIPVAADLVRKIRRILPDLRREFPLRNLALFGSVARGDAHQGSDIDILVDVDADAATNVVGLEACKNAVVHEMFYRLVGLGRAKDVRKFSMPTSSQAQTASSRTFL
jgi:predicted nucleotidyltransferase